MKTSSPSTPAATSPDGTRGVSRRHRGQCRTPTRPMGRPALCAAAATAWPRLRLCRELKRREGPRRTGATRFASPQTVRRSGKCSAASRGSSLSFSAVPQVPSDRARDREALPGSRGRPWRPREKLGRAARTADRGRRRGSAAISTQRSPAEGARRTQRRRFAEPWKPWLHPHPHLHLHPHRPRKPRALFGDRLFPGGRGTVGTASPQTLTGSPESSVVLGRSRRRRI